MSTKPETAEETARRWYVKLFGKKDADALGELGVVMLVVLPVAVLLCFAAALFFLLGGN